ncbi:Solute carrier family 35 member F1 [Glycine max]|nr:Solute carrier family 35 member F1 [Glycine max]
MMFDFGRIWTPNTLIGLGLGQFLSLLITSTGFTSSQLAKKGINAPTSQSFLNYVFLSLVYGTILLYRRKALKAKWYYYIILGLVDVEANFLVVKAYQYTSLTSVMLLDCWSIPSVMLLTWLFLKTKYRFKKITGVVVCVAGLVLVVFSDVHSGDRAGGSNPRKGDLLVIVGATLYAISNVSEEFLVKNADRVELMAMLGLSGGIISAIQISILERNELKSIHWSAEAALPFVGFAVAMFMFYSLVPVLLKINGSTMLNLSLLTSDMWAVLIRIFAYHEKVDWMYFVSFGAVTIGLIIYSGGDIDEDQHPPNAAIVDLGPAVKQDEEANSGNHSKGTAAGSSKTWVAYSCKIAIQEANDPSNAALVHMSWIGIGMEKVKVLRRLLETPGVHQGPACFDALGAKLIESAGFPYCITSGFSIAASRLALPDTGFISYGEMLEQGQLITQAVSIPVIGDADNGYGNAMNLKRTVKGFIAAGFAGIILEDQIAPKACGHTRGRKVIPREEGVMKIRAAVDARRESGSDIVIVARTDARQAVSLEEALTRCKAYGDAGADVLFIDALASVQEMKALCQLSPHLPKLANMLEGGGKTPILSPQELEDVGYKLAIYPISLIGVCIRAMQDALTAIKGGAVPPPGSMPSFEEIKDIVGFNSYYKEEERYATSTNHQP